MERLACCCFNRGARADQSLRRPSKSDRNTPDAARNENRASNTELTKLNDPTAMAYLERRSSTVDFEDNQESLSSSNNQPAVVSTEMDEEKCDKSAEQIFSDFLNGCLNGCVEYEGLELPKDILSIIVEYDGNASEFVFTSRGIKYLNLESLEDTFPGKFNRDNTKQLSATFIRQMDSDPDFCEESAAIYIPKELEGMDIPRFFESYKENGVYFIFGLCRSSTTPSELCSVAQIPMKSGWLLFAETPKMPTSEEGAELVELVFAKEAGRLTSKEMLQKCVQTYHLFELDQKQDIVFWSVTTRRTKPFLSIVPRGGGNFVKVIRNGN